MSNEFGSFSGNPKTEWLIDANGEDRDMQLLEDFFYVDPAGRTWPAPKGSVINGASIPRALWTTVGSPYTDDYRRASVVHDVACEPSSGVPRKEADEMFYYACRAGGCGEVQARVLYAGVRVGAWADKTMRKSSPAVTGRPLRALRSVVGGQTADEIYLAAKFGEILADVERLPPNASISDLDNVIASHIQV